MARIISRSGTELTVEFTVDIKGTLFEAEQAIQQACNEVGRAVTREAVAGFDTDGSSLMTGTIKWTSKGKSCQTYQSPYGPVKVDRHLYQTSQGGRTWCPLEARARIIRDATPWFAKQLSHKYAQSNAKAVRVDLQENHGRQIAKSYVQNVVDWVGSIAEATEESWSYALPKLDCAIATVVVSLDGAHILMQEDGWRESMVGTISLYDVEGERQHTIYLGSAPQYGKEAFKRRLEQELEQVKSHYPEARYLGIADGAKDNWNFLTPHTDEQLVDFFHATEYLAEVAQAAYPQKTSKPQRQRWLHDRCHRLKHHAGAVGELIEEMKTLQRKRNLTVSVRENLEKALTYFENQQHRMDYASHTEQNFPIGSGVTEAACKTLVKQRLCCSGMRWKNQGAGIVLRLRGLVQSVGRWAQFWTKIDQFGVPCST